MKFPGTALDFICVTYYPLMEKHALMLTSLIMSNMCLTMWLTPTPCTLKIYQTVFLLYQSTGKYT